MTDAVEVACFPPDLLAGDELLSTGLGGWTGTIAAVRSYEQTTVIDLEGGGSVVLPNFEGCSVRRRPLAQVHDIFAGLMGAARRMGR